MFSVNQMLRGLGGKQDEKLNFKAISLVREVLRQGNSIIMIVIMSLTCLLQVRIKEVRIILGRLGVVL